MNRLVPVAAGGAQGRFIVFTRYNLVTTLPLQVQEPDLRSGLRREGLPQQKEIQRYHDAHRQPAKPVRDRTVHEVAHDLAVAGEKQERNEGKGQRKAQDDLREDEYPQGVQAAGDDDDGGDKGEQPPQEDAEADIEEAFDDHLSGHGADG